MFFWLSVKTLLQREAVVEEMIKFNCNECDQPYRVSGRYAGKRVRCKDCGRVSWVPQMDNDTLGKGDSLAAYNNLLKQLSKSEKTAPTITS